MATTESGCGKQVLSHVFNTENEKNYGRLNKFEYRIAFDYQK